MRAYTSVPDATRGLAATGGIRVLSQDTDTGCTTALWRLPADGSIVDLGVPGYDAEYGLVTGHLVNVGGHRWGEHGYRTVPMGSSLAVSALEDAVVIRRTLVAREDRSEARAVDPAYAQWVDVTGTDRPGLSRLPLRVEPERGDCTMLVRFAPGWVSPHGEHFHTSFEEVLILDGRIETAAGNSAKHSYLCKPAFRLQSPPRSSGGALAWISHGGRMDFRPARELRFVQAASSEP